MVLILEDILHHLHNDTSTVVHVLSSLLMYLRNEILRSSLFMSLQSKFQQLSLLVCLRKGFLQSSPYTITSIQSKPELGSKLTSLRKLFLQHLYKDIPTITPIPSKPETLLQRIRGSMTTPIQVKPEMPKSWMSLCQSLQLYVGYFYKFITYFMIDHKYNIYTWNIKTQLVGYTMVLKRKRGAKVKAKVV